MKSFAFVLIMSTFVGLGSLAHAGASTTATTDSEGGAVYKACYLERAADISCGILDCDNVYFTNINAVTFVKAKDGSVSRSEERIFGTPYGVLEQKDADLEARKVLRSFVAQSICPAGALNN
jgi:hypothetical protein